MPSALPGLSDDDRAIHEFLNGCCEDDIVYGATFVGHDDARADCNGFQIYDRRELLGFIGELHTPALRR